MRNMIKWLYVNHLKNIKVADTSCETCNLNDLSPIPRAKRTSHRVLNRNPSYLAINPRLGGFPGDHLQRNPFKRVQIQEIAGPTFYFGKLQVVRDVEVNRDNRHLLR